MEQFYTQTANCLWRLPSSRQEYYQAEVKTISLVKDRLIRLLQLVHSNKTVADLPSYVFKPPGRIIQTYNSFNRLVSVLTDNFYWDYVWGHRKLPWRYDVMLMNANIGPELYQRSRQLRKASTIFLPRNPNLFNTSVVSSQDLDRNTNLTFDFVLQNRYHIDSDSWTEISANPKITLADITSYCGMGKCRKQLQVTNLIPWCPRGLSRNPNITWEFVKERIIKNFDWDWLALSANPAITWEIIRANPGTNKPHRQTKGNTKPYWDWNGISVNPNITWEIIQANPYCNWNPDYVSGNINITMQIVEANPNYPWTCHGLSINRNLTWAFIEAHPEIEWDWSNISGNDMLAC